MSWNYRVIAFREEHDDYYEICAVYYDENKQTEYYTQNQSVFWTEEDDPKEEISRISMALDKPVLEAADFK